MSYVIDFNAYFVGNENGNGNGKKDKIK